MANLDLNATLFELSATLRDLDPESAQNTIGLHITRALYYNDHETLLILAFAWALAGGFCITERVGEDFVTLVEYGAYRGKLDS